MAAHHAAVKLIALTQQQEQAALTVIYVTEQKLVMVQAPVRPERLLSVTTGNSVPALRPAILHKAVRLERRQTVLTG